MTTDLLLLKNANVFASEPLGHQHLLLAAGRIVWMGETRIDLPQALNAQVIDCEGMAVVPGFIDAHVHVTGGGGEMGFASRVPAPMLSRYTSVGVTTVVGLLGTDDTARSTRELVAQIYALREAGLSAYGYTGGYHVPLATLTGSVRGDIAFIEPLIGVGELAISDHRSSQPTLDELLRVAADAHVAGLMTGKAGCVHLHLGDGLRGLELVRQAREVSELPARVLQPTHVNRRKGLFEEAVALGKTGTPIDITAFPVADDEDAWDAATAYTRALDAGVPRERITISSDAGGCLPCFDGDGHICSMEVGSAGALIDTLRTLVNAGMPLQHALPAFTSNVATQLRLKNKGRIATGMDADLIVLDGECTPVHVIARGQLHVQAGQQRLRGMFEGPSSL